MLVEFSSVESSEIVYVRVKSKFNEYYRRYVPTISSTTSRKIIEKFYPNKKVKSAFLIVTDLKTSKKWGVWVTSKGTVLNI